MTRGEPDSVNKGVKQPGDGLTHYALSDTGRRRPHNEDFHGAYPELGLYVVADGMGGHQAGEVASRVVVEFIAERVRAGQPLRESVAQAHAAVLSAVSEGEGREGMGSTVVAARIRGGAYEIAWAGDSRAYGMSRVLVRLTRDHSLVQEMVDRGDLSERQARLHPERSLITRAMGMPEAEAMEVDLVRGRLEPGMTLLLCSDGLTEELTDVEIERVLAESRDLESAAGQLVEQALAAGGNDNITVLLVRVDGDLARLPQSRVRLAIAALVGLTAAGVIGGLLVAAGLL